VGALSRSRSEPREPPARGAPQFFSDPLGRRPARVPYPAVGLLLGTALAVALASPARAQSPEASVARADTAGLRVHLVTIGPGEQVWERFGHNAIRISDPVSGLDLSYNWGMFSFDQPGFLGRVLRGTMLYWMAPFETEGMVSAYAAADRSVWVQELALTRAQREELRALLALNALPENRFYRYDYYRDNCSTRVRDALDRVLDGRLRTALAGIATGTTHRWHTRRLLRHMPAMYTGSQLVLSGKADRPIDRWEEAFLPIKLMEALRDLRVIDEAGVERPLVREERELYRSREVTEPPVPSSGLLWYLAGGLALGAAVVALARADAPARVALALLGAGWSVMAGVGGAVLLGAWLFTDHAFWYPNWNLLQLNPLSVVLVILLLPLLVRRRPGASAVGLAAAIGVLSLLGLLVHLVPGIEQRNGEILALTVPIHLGLAVALVRLAVRSEVAPAA